MLSLNWQISKRFEFNKPKIWTQVNPSIEMGDTMQSLFLLRIRRNNFEWLFDQMNCVHMSPMTWFKLYISSICISWISANCNWYICFFNASPPSVPYMPRWTGSSLVSIMACRLFGCKPLSKPKMTSHRWKPTEPTSMKKKEKELANFHWYYTQSFHL